MPADAEVAEKSEIEQHIESLTPLPEGWSLFGVENSEAVILENAEMKVIHQFDDYRQATRNEIAEIITYHSQPVEPEKLEEQVRSNDAPPLAHEVPGYVTHGGILTKMAIDDLVKGLVVATEPQLMRSYWEWGEEYRLKMQAYLMVRQIGVLEEIRELLKSKG